MLFLLYICFLSCNILLLFLPLILMFVSKKKTKKLSHFSSSSSFFQSYRIEFDLLSFEQFFYIFFSQSYTLAFCFFIIRTFFHILFFFLADACSLIVSDFERDIGKSSSSYDQDHYVGFRTNVHEKGSNLAPLYTILTWFVVATFLEKKKKIVNAKLKRDGIRQAILLSIHHCYYGCSICVALIGNCIHDIALSLVPLSLSLPFFFYLFFSLLLYFLFCFSFSLPLYLSLTLSHSLSLSCSLLISLSHSLSSFHFSLSVSLSFALSISLCQSTFFL